LEFSSRKSVNSLGHMYTICFSSSTATTTPPSPSPPPLPPHRPSRVLLFPYTLATHIHTCANARFPIQLNYYYRADNETTVVVWIATIYTRTLFYTYKTHAYVSTRIRRWREPGTHTRAYSIMYVCVNRKSLYNL
jgi:hypothetical protein